MLKIRPMFLALLMAIAVMSGAIPAAAQTSSACPLLDSLVTADGFRLSVFGAGGVTPASIPDQVAVTLGFHGDEHSPACSGEQSAILIVDAHEVEIMPPYHVRINEAWITFTDQFALGLASTRDRMVLSPLDGTVVVLSEFTNNVTIVPLGYTTQIGLDGVGGSVTGDWQANAAMDGVSLATLRNLAFEHPDLALATPTDEQALAAAQTIAANPPQAPVTAAVPDVGQSAQAPISGQSPHTAPAQLPSGGQQGQPSTGDPSGQSSGNTSGQTSSRNSSGQGSSNDESGRTRPGEGQSGQSSSSGRTTVGTGNQGTIGTTTVPHIDPCAHLGPGCVPAAEPQVGGTGPNPCNGCQPGITVEIEQPNVIISPLLDAVRPINIGLDDRIHIDELPYGGMPQVNGPGY